MGDNEMLYADSQLDGWMLLVHFLREQQPFTLG